MSISPKLKAGCGALFLFSTGVVCGMIVIIMLMVYFIPRIEGLRSEKSKEFLVNHFTRQLELTDSQVEELRPDFEAFLDEKWQLRADFLEENHKMTEEYFETSVKGKLNPDQQKRAEAAIENLWREKRKQKLLGPENES